MSFVFQIFKPKMLVLLMDVDGANELHHEALDDLERAKGTSLVGTNRHVGKIKMTSMSTLPSDCDSPYRAKQQKIPESD